MNKSVEGSLSANSGGASDASALGDSSAGADERIVRKRRRRHHHRHQTLSRRSGRGREIAFVTLLALAILFGILYYLLPHYQAQGQPEESTLAPARPTPAAPHHS